MKNKIILSSILLIVLILGLSTITAANTTTTTSIEKQTIDTTTTTSIDNKEKVIANDNKEIKSLIKDTTTKEITKHQLNNQKKIKKLYVENSFKMANRTTISWVCIFLIERYDTVYRSTQG